MTWRMSSGGRRVRIPSFSGLHHGVGPRQIGCRRGIWRQCAYPTRRDVFASQGLQRVTDQGTRLNARTATRSTLPWRNSSTCSTSGKLYELDDVVGEDLLRTYAEIQSSQVQSGPSTRSLDT